ncbi:MAG: hypothetical protein RSB76_02565 [Clostridia bacterium]
MTKTDELYFNVKVIFNENGKSFNNLMCDIVNTFLVRDMVNTFENNQNDIYCSYNDC